MLSYLNQFSSIAKVPDELNASRSIVKLTLEDDKSVLAEFVSLLSKVRHVACKLEADCYLTMLRAVRVFRDLFDAFSIIAEAVRLSCCSQRVRCCSFTFDKDHRIDSAIADTCRADTAGEDKNKDECRKTRPHHHTLAKLAIRNSEKVCDLSENF